VDSANGYVVSFGGGRAVLDALVDWVARLDGGQAPVQQAVQESPAGAALGAK
jgi:hypothetical protein